MSELKADKTFVFGEECLAYKKYEADKVIALLTDKANYNDYAYKLKSEELADTCRFYEEELRHQKYKRCLAMARWCESALSVYPWYGEISHEERRWLKWQQRWLELAEKFKPNKEAK